LASYRGVSGTLAAIENFFKARIPAEFTNVPVSARVELLGSRGVAAAIAGNALCIYMHRVVVDAYGRSRHFPQHGTDRRAPAGELPVNLHFLLIATGSSAAIEADLLSWAMLELANDGRLDISHLGESDSGWTEREMVNITPDEVSTETLLRIWDIFKADYTSSVPYVARTVRLRLREPLTEGPAVITRALPTGEAEE
jgi:hypothetical protein